MKARLVLLSILLAVFSIPETLVGQESASITGTVTDPTGATVAGAQVTVASPERGINRTTQTNSDGEYSVPALPPGTYTLTITAPGFKKYEAPGVILRVAQKARNDVSLQVGSTTTAVEVQGTTIAQVETQSSELAGVVTGKEINQLELNGRNFAQLVTLVPGVSNQSGQDEGLVGVQGSVAFSINGGRTEYNNWELDGGDNLDNGSNTSMNVYPSLDAIAEFKVLTSNYGAQYGRNGSGTVEVETKSGTSSFHGDVYEYNRNDFFNARNYFNDPPTPMPAYKKNDYGYTIGGPVYIPGVYNTKKDKTFFFWSQEWRKDKVPAASNAVIVPSLAERMGNFSDLCPAAGTPFLRTSTSSSVTVYPDCPAASGPDASGFFTTFPNNTVTIDKAHGADALENLIPAPTSNIPGAATWQAFPILPTDWREELIRVDQNLGSSSRVMFRYIHDSWSTIYPNPLWTSGTTFPTLQTNFNGPSVGMVARLTTSFSPTLLNEFVASYTTDHINLTLVGPWQRPASITWGLFNNGSTKIPGINLSGGIYSGIAEDPGYIPNGPLNSNPTYTYRDNVTKIIGRHNLQFGAYFTTAQKNEIPQPSISTNGFVTYDTSKPVSTGNAFADLLVGNVAEFQQQKAVIKTYNRYKLFEPYFQDDWHATSRLTLNLGLRLSLFGTQYERYHNAWNFDPSKFVPGASNLDPSTGLLVPGGNQLNGWVDCGVGGVPSGCAQNHLFNPAPRIGFAYDVFGNGKTAIRGGYGIFYEHMNSNENGTGALEPQNPATLTTSVFDIVGYAAIAPPTAASPLGAISIPTKMTWPYVQQWHFDIQHDLLKNTIATVAYVGSKGTHLSREFDLNQVFPTGLTSANPYKPGEAIGPKDCGPVPPGGTLFPVDAFGVPTAATTPSGVPLPYGGPGVLSPAANLGIAACGTNPDLFRPFFGAEGIRRFSESADSSYHALQLNLRHTVGGLILNGSYTWSHSIDDASSGIDTYFPDTYHLSRYRASSNYDQRQLFSLSYVYDLPFFRGSGLGNKLLGGWQWSGITIVQTGTPFSIVNGGAAPVPSDNAGVSNTITSTASFADRIGSATSGIPQAPVSGFGPLLYNPGAFAAPTGLTFGNVPRNFLNNPRRTNFDMALFKHFRITESVGVQFRAEAFNIFNHPEWAWLGGGTGSAANNSAFSSPTNTTSCYGGANNSSGDPSCTGSVGFLHVAAAHNPRIMQFGLKLIF